MYKGVIGPPGILEYFYVADGEQYYDLVESEMFLISLATCSLILFLVRKLMGKMHRFKG